MRNFILQNFPFLEDDFDALTDYQLFCKMLSYVKVFAKDNQEFKKQLEKYEEYFNNLDVQEEIDKKLDEMYEDGTLENIISQYIQLQLTYTYNSVSDMKLATNLVAGSFTRTSGFYSYNDGGGALYKIRELTVGDTIDEKFLISLYDDSLVAELVWNHEINILSIGAKADDTTDIGVYIQSAINKLVSSGGVIYIPYGEYKLLTPISIETSNYETIQFKGEYSIIHVNLTTANQYAITCTADTESGNNSRVAFKGLSFYNQSNSELNINCFKFQKVTQREIFDNILINGFYNNLYLKNCWNLLFTKLSSVNSVNAGVLCENVTNAFKFDTCIFQNNLNYNVYITGKNHTFINCDFSIYKTNSVNRFSGCGGLNLIGCYYEEANNPTNPFYFNQCEFTMSGCYFDLSSEATEYNTLYFNQCMGTINGNYVRGYSDYTYDNDSYIIKILSGSHIDITGNLFYYLKNVIYIHNSRLHTSTNRIDNVECYITQNNHRFAQIYGDIETDNFDNCILPYKAVVNLKLIDELTFGNTANIPTGRYVGQQYFDTQANVLKVYNGSNWV